MFLIAIRENRKTPIDLIKTYRKKKSSLFLTIYTVLAIIGFAWVLVRIVEFLFIGLMFGIPLIFYFLSRKERKSNATINRRSTRTT